MTGLASLLCMLILTATYTTEDLGPHNIDGQGCLACHPPTTASSLKPSSPYLWGDFSQTIYTTVTGSQLTLKANAGDDDPSVHSTVCLGCHDSALAPSGSGPVSALSGHPVNVSYVLGRDGHWPGTVTSSGVAFAPSYFDSAYGRSLRFYVSRGVPYIECGTCHDPHHYSRATVTIDGQSVEKPTAHFLRGWFEETNQSSTSASQFCRGCHFDLSNEAYGLKIATR